MKKTLAALAGVGAVLLVSACGSSDDTTTTEDTASETVTVTEGDAGTSTTWQLGDDYTAVCEGMLGHFEEMKEWGQDPEEIAAGIIDAQQQVPQWTELSEEQQNDTVRAIENAAKGQC